MKSCHVEIKGPMLYIEHKPEIFAVRLDAIRSVCLCEKWNKSVIEMKYDRGYESSSMSWGIGEQTSDAGAIKRNTDDAIKFFERILSALELIV